MDSRHSSLLFIFHHTLWFIVGCVQSCSYEITLLETDSADYITRRSDAIWDCISAVRPARISAFFKFITDQVTITDIIRAEAGCETMTQQGSCETQLHMESDIFL